MTIVPFPDRNESVAVDPVAWREVGLCNNADPEAFFDDDVATARIAKKVCGGCPVKTLCLAEAFRQMLGGEIVWGVWGATTKRERSRYTLEEAEAVIREADMVLWEAAA